MRLGNSLLWEKRSGEPLTLDNVQLTPQTRVLRVRFPFGGLVWNRPVSVIVERAGKRETLRVPDVTLMTTIAFVVSLFAIPIWILAVLKGVNK
jgi:hypothetical protein